MSRIAKEPVIIPKDIEINISGQTLMMKGSKGSLSMEINNEVQLEKQEDVFKVQPRSKSKFSLAMSGTTRALIANMVEGVSQGFEKKLELVGVGYRAQSQGKKLNLTLGFSHPVVYDVPEGIQIETPSQTEILVKGIDKQRVGQVAAEIRRFRPPEPYKGKGVRYADENVVIKEAKKKLKYKEIKMKLNKKQNRLRRARKSRAKIKELEMNRLSVHRTPKHIYAQIIDPNGDKILTTASTIEKKVKKDLKVTGNIDAASYVGKLIADKAKKIGIETVAFDRSGFLYHGRIKALAEAAREAGLKF